ncbi:hypothetical protein MTO96_047784 [Rhipicephalus appendiculatus]
MMLRPLLKPKKVRQARAEAGRQGKAGGWPGPASPVQKYVPPPRYITARKQVVEPAQYVPQLALPGPEPKNPSSAETAVSRDAGTTAEAQVVHVAKQDQAPGTSPTTPSSSGHSAKHGTDEAGSQLSEPNFTWTPTASVGTRKSYYFPDPPLPKEVRFAMALLVLAILSVALLLAYDVYHSFNHMPLRSNVTASSLSPTTTEPIPTPVFMR